MTPVVLLPWQQFYQWSCLNKNWKSQFLSQPSIIHSQQSNEESLDNIEHVCFEQDLLSHLKGLQIGIFRFWQKETGAKRVALARATQVSFCFTCIVHFWCQVWRLPLQYFKRYSWLSILLYQLHSLLRHRFPNLHNIYKNIYISRTKTDVPKRNTPFCCIF